ncbi:MAG: DUF4129 domain-containing protein [Nocardioidaceae bacterium]
MTLREPPVDVARGTARRAVEDELGRGVYEDESLVETVLRWLQETFLALVAQVSQGGLRGVVSLLILGAVLVGLTGLLLWSLRRISRSAGVGTTGGLDASGQTAGEHRATAEQLARDARWPQAIRERMRAVARILEEREILSALPGRTADELASAAGRALPTLDARLNDAARLFDRVTYGEDPGSAEDYASVAELDAALNVAEPAMSAP